MGRDLIVALITVSSVVSTLLLAQRIGDTIARKRHWRIGRRLSILLGMRRCVGDACLVCKTDYRYVFGHPIRYTGTTRETARAIFPLCQRCWIETSETEHLMAAGQILNAWRRGGVYGDGDTFNQDEWDSNRVEIYAAIKAGL